MNYYNKSSSPDESWPKLALPYEDFDVILTDINEADLVNLGHNSDFQSAVEFMALTLDIWLRLFASVQPDSKAINIWFLIDTSSPYTSLSVKSLEALLGSGHATHGLYSLAIQGQKSNIECKVSKGHYKDANVLGADSMRRLKLSIVVDWEKWTFKLVK